MSDWTYGDFPVDPDSYPLYGNGDVVQTLQPNELREAVLRRADLIGVSVSVPAEVVDLEACYLDWLNGMRAAIEQLLAAGEYGRMHREYVDPDWTPLAWAPWTREALLDRVHFDFIDNALVSDPENWMEAVDAGSGLEDGKPWLLGNPFFHVSGDPGDVLADYDLRGLRRGVNLDDDMKLYVSVLDEGGGNYRIRFYRDVARNYETAYTDPFPGDIATDGPVTVQFYPVWGYILIGSLSVTKEITGPNTSIEIQVEYDRSIMYAAHINELYYAIEFLAYLEVASGLTATPGYTESAYGLGDGPGLDPWDWESMYEAYEEGWAMFEAGGYSPSGGSLEAEAYSHLYFDEWEGGHYYYVSDTRVLDVAVTLPTTAWPMNEVAIPFWSAANDPFMMHYAEGFDCTMDGDEDWSRFGNVTEDWWGGYSFYGWLAWPGEFSGDTVSFDYGWNDIAEWMWGGPDLHDAQLYVHIDDYLPLIVGFAFEDLGGQYRNFDWSPIADWEWGISWPW